MMFDKSQWLEKRNLNFFLTNLFFLISLVAEGAETKSTSQKNIPSSPAALRKDLDYDEDSDFPSSPQIRAIPGGQASPSPEVHRENGKITLVGGQPANGVISGKALAEVFENPVKETDVIQNFNFSNANLKDVVIAVGKLFRENYIFEDTPNGKVTIISNGPITVKMAKEVFLAALDGSGFSLYRLKEKENFFRIAKVRDVREKQVDTYIGNYSPNTDALITRVFDLRYTDADEISRAFRNFTPTSARVIPYSQTNKVIVTDTGSNIIKLESLLKILDVEGYNTETDVIPVKYALASKLANMIDALTSNSSLNLGSGRSGSSKFNARKTREGGIINNVIADDHTNSLIVHANQKGINQIKKLVARLDQNKPSPNAAEKVHIYYLRFAEAEQVASTLNNLSSQSSGSSRSSGGTGLGSNPNSIALFQDAVKVSADKASNSLVITASSSDYLTMKRVVERLDMPRDQVYVEAVIMDVALAKGDNTSANIGFIPNGMNAPIGSLPGASDFIKMATQPGSLSGGLMAYPIGGGTVQLTTSAGTVTVPRGMAMLQALRSYSHSNILATPQIIALDNSESTFEMSEKIPVPTTSSNQGVTTTGYNTQSVTLSLTIKPQINKGEGNTEEVTLSVNAKMGNISNTNVPDDVKGKAFGTIERVAKTSVIVSNGDTVVLGGLIQDKVVKSEQKVPLLGDIPILNFFFKTYSNSVQKTNLLIFLTPKILRRDQKNREVLNQKLSEQSDFINKHIGSDDSLNETRDKIISNLPKIDLNTDNTKRDPASVSVKFSGDWEEEEFENSKIPAIEKNTKRDPASTSLQFLNNAENATEPAAQLISPSEKSVLEEKRSP